MMVSDSGREVWDGVLNAPPECCRPASATRVLLDQLLFFRPLPYVRRVVFIAAPHRGSQLANGPVGRYFGGRVRAPSDQARGRRRGSRRGTGPTRSGTRTSRASRSTRSATSGSIARSLPGRLPPPVTAGVLYHTIAFRFAGHAPGDRGRPALEPPHLDGAASEAVFPGYHGSEQRPAPPSASRAILLEHPGGAGPRAGTAPASSEVSW